MLVNIHLNQNWINPTKWNENVLSKSNEKRSEYIKALKKADDFDYSCLIELQNNV